MTQQFDKFESKKEVVENELGPAIPDLNFIDTIEQQPTQTSAFAA